MIVPAFLTKLREKAQRLLPAASSGKALRELQAHAPILPILSSQLRNASQDMESEVSKVCQSFHGMASKAMGTVASTSHILHGEGEGGSDISSVILGCRETMITLLERMERGGELSQRAIQKMEQVGASVSQVASVLRELDHSAFANKIVAMNARIEAAHLGDAGKGFEVVAEEISNQAERSTTLTCEVEGILKGLVESARTAVRELSELSTEDRAWIQSSRDDIHRTLTALERANGEMRGSLQQASEQSGQLAAEIEAALINLQFQDRVNQRIQHVVESLDSMHLAISTSEEHGVSQAVEERRREISSNLAASYTMGSERVIHGENTAVAAENNQESDVELF